MTVRRFTFHADVSDSQADTIQDSVENHLQVGFGIEVEVTIEDL